MESAGPVPALRPSMTPTSGHDYIGRRLSLTAKAVRTYAEQQMAAAGASLTVAIVTRIVENNGPLAQRDLAQRLGVEGPTMARHIDRMERDGIVTRTRDVVDRRVQRVALTPHGRALCARLHVVSQRAHEDITAALTASELAQLEALLDRVAARAAALAESPAAPDHPGVVSA